MSEKSIDKEIRAIFSLKSCRESNFFMDDEDGNDKWDAIDKIVSRAVELMDDLEALREERKANPGVWDKAPENATQVKMMFEETHENGYTQGIAMLGYTRTPPKDATRLMAERIADAICLEDTFATDIIER